MNAGMTSASKAALITLSVLCVMLRAAFAMTPGQSTYTKLDLAACEVLSQMEEGGSVSLKCEGLPGYPVYVNEGDLRFDVDFGVPDETFATYGPFNTIGDTIEWRLSGTVPVAAILRYHLDSGMTGTDADKAQVLTVFRIGTEGLPGCVMGGVDATVEQANGVARGMAAMVSQFQCGSSAPVIVAPEGSIATSLTGSRPE